MRGLVFKGDREISLQEFEDPIPGPAEVVLSIKASGMCGSDLHMYRRPSQTTPVRSALIAGHEAAGNVVTVGPGVAANVATVGDRVMVHRYSGCAICRRCRGGWSELCKAPGARIFGANALWSHASHIGVAPRSSWVGSETFQ